jgi:hypothetical protein
LDYSHKTRCFLYTLAHGNIRISFSTYCITIGTNFTDIPVQRKLKNIPAVGNYPLVSTFKGGRFPTLRLTSTVPLGALLKVTPPPGNLQPVLV